MFADNYIREQARQTLVNHPSAAPLAPHQADIHTQQTYNHELERLRREQAQKANS